MDIPVAGGDLISSLPTDDSNPTSSELSIMDKIFKKKKKVKKTENDEISKERGDSKEKNSIILPTLIGGVISALLALPFFNKLLQMCGVDNMIINIIAHFVVFTLLYFLVLKSMQKTA